MNCLSNINFLTYYNDNLLNNKLSVVDDVIEDIISSNNIKKNKKINTKLNNNKMIKSQLPILLESNIINNNVNKELPTSIEQNNSIHIIEKPLENLISNQFKFTDNGTSPMQSITSKIPSSSSLENLISSSSFSSNNNNNNNNNNISVLDDKDNISINNNTNKKILIENDNIYNFNKYEIECNYDWDKDVEINQLKHISNLSNWRQSIMENIIKPINEVIILENDDFDHNDNNNNNSNNNNNNSNNNDDAIDYYLNNNNNNNNNVKNTDEEKNYENKSNNNIQEREYKEFEIDILDDYSLLNIDINKENSKSRELRDSLSLNDIINKQNDQNLIIISSSDVNNNDSSTSRKELSDDISLNSILNQFNIARNANKRIATNTSNSLDEFEFEELNCSILSNKLKSKINSRNNEINNSIISKNSKNMVQINKPIKKKLSHKEIYQKEVYDKIQYYHKHELLRIKSKQVTSNIINKNKSSPIKTTTNFIKKNLNVFNNINNKINNVNSSKLIVNQNENIKEITEIKNNKEIELNKLTKVKSSIDKAFQSSNIKIQQQITSLLSKSLISNNVQTSSSLEQINFIQGNKSINKQEKSKNIINSPPRTKINKTKNQLVSAKNIIESFATNSNLLKNNTPSQSLIGLFDDKLPVPPPPSHSLLQNDNKLIDNRQSKSSINNNNNNNNYYDTDDDYFNNYPIADKKNNLITFSF